MGEMKWYVVQAYSGYENKVKLALEERIKQEGLESLFGEILIPKENVQETRAGKKRVGTRNFYPGYVFVQMDLNDDSWLLIKNTPKVSGFVGGSKPSPVPEREISAIAQQVAEGAAKPLVPVRCWKTLESWVRECPAPRFPRPAPTRCPRQSRAGQ